MPEQQRVFVGREQELAALKQAIARPEGQLILAVGGIGFGKTALLEELNAQVADDERYFGLLYRLNRNDTSEAFLSRLMGDLLNIRGLTRRRLVLNAPRQVNRWKTLAKLIPEVGQAVAELIPEDRRPIRDPFLEFLHAAAGQLEDWQRLVLIFDPDEYLDDSVEADWVSLTRDLPAQTTMVFAQRLDDCLARSAGLRRAGNVSRIPDGLAHLSREDSDDLVAARWDERSAWKELGDSARDALQDELWGKYDGYALPLTMALRDLPQGPTSAEQLLEPSRALPSDYAAMLRDRYDDAVETGDDATRVLHGLAILEVPATCERLAALYADRGREADSLVSACRRETVARCLTFRDGGAVEFFHATMGECILAQMSEEAKRDLHRWAAGLYGEDLKRNKSDREALDRLPYHAYHGADEELFLKVIGRVGEQKYRLRMLRSYLRDLRWALPICSRLAAAEPEAFQAHLAAVLNDQAAVLAHLGEKRKAASAFVHVVCACRQGIRFNAQSFRRTLANGLMNLGNVLTEIGEPERALPAYEEALATYEELGSADDESFAPHVATILSNMSAALRRAGQPAQSCCRARRAVELYRGLRAKKGTHFDAPLADALNNLGNALLDMSELEEAHTAHHEALGIRRRLAKHDPAAFEQDVAMSLTNLGMLYGHMGKLEDALECCKTALGVLRTLANAEPAAFEPMAGMVSDNLANVLLAAGEMGEARDAYDIALTALTRWVQREHGAYLEDLRKAVRNAERLVEETGDKPEDWPALAEAVKLLEDFQATEEDTTQDQS